MATFISHSPADTQSLGETWGRSTASGLVIGLSGDLGTGKTQLVKGLARGLGFTGRVSSPTFALVNIYEGGRLTLFHLDLYRLDTPEQIISAGLEEYLQPRGVTVIEWAERWFGTQSIVRSLKSKVQSPKSATPSLKSQVSSLKGQAPSLKVGSIDHERLAVEQVLHVHFETISETERRVTYEDPGA